MIFSLLSPVLSGAKQNIGLNFANTKLMGTNLQVRCPCSRRLL